MGSSPIALEEERVTFLNPSGEQLVGLLLDAVDTREAVVLCHGYMSQKNGFHYPAMAQQLQGRGVSSLRFDFAGNGESQGTFDFCAYHKEVDDIRAAVEQLRARGKRVISVVGHSKGAAEVLLYGSRFNDVPKVVNISARFNMTRGIVERFGNDIFDRLRDSGKIEMASRSGAKWQLTYESLMERINTDMGAAATAIQTFVLTVHGSADETIPVEDAHQFDALIKQHTLRVIPGADHCYTQPNHAAELMRYVVDFVTEN